MTVQRLANESPAYQKLRSELLEAEIALKDQRERVAELRRRLAPGTPVETDWCFREVDLAGDGPARAIRLSELFGDRDTLILVHFMFGGAQQQPCPMCTLWADGYDGVVPHVRQRAELAIVVEGDALRFREHARSRRWRHVRLLSSGGSSFKDELRMQDAAGAQQPGVSVFQRSADGRVHHFYTGGAILAPGHWRGMDLLSPVWNFLDLTPEGRGDWMPRLAYD